MKSSIQAVKKEPIEIHAMGFPAWFPEELMELSFESHREGKFQDTIVIAQGICALERALAENPKTNVVFFDPPKTSDYPTLVQKYFPIFSGKGILVLVTPESKEQLPARVTSQVSLATHDPMYEMPSKLIPRLEDLLRSQQHARNA